MREFFNKLTIAGVLVKNGLEKKTDDKGNDYIGGSLVIRTADGSENEFNMFSYKFKKDANGNFTTDENKNYKSYETIIDEYKDIEHYPNEPDVVSIKSGSFTANDFKDPKTGEIVSTNKFRTTFANRVEPKDLETTIHDAKFEIEGVIESIKDEIFKNEPTGNQKIILNAISQNREGKGKEAKFTPREMFPVTLTVPKELVEPFSTAGYYEGAFVKFSGKLINTTEKVTTVEKQAFGADLVKTFDKTIKMFEVTSGSTPVSIYDVELTDEIATQLMNKRKLHLSQIKAGVGKDENSSSTSSATSTPTAPKANPFASNPFANH